MPDRLNDVVIPGTPTQISAYGSADFSFIRIRVSIEQLDSRNHHARGAEPALQPVLLPKAFLDCVIFAVGCQTFNGGDLPTVRLDREHSARFQRPAIQEHGARSAAARVARQVRSRQFKDITQKMNKQQPWLNIDRMFNTIDGYAYPLGGHG